MHFHKLQIFLKIFCLNLQSPVWVSLHHRQSKMPTILGILGHVMLQCTLAKYGYGAAMLVYLHFTPTSHSKEYKHLKLTLDS